MKRFHNKMYPFHTLLSLYCSYSCLFLKWHRLRPIWAQTGSTSSIIKVLLQHLDQQREEKCLADQLCFWNPVYTYSTVFIVFSSEGSWQLYQELVRGWSMIYYVYKINYGEFSSKSHLCLISQWSTWCFFNEWSCKQSTWVHVEPPLTRSNFDPCSEVLSKGMAGAAGLAAAVPILPNDRATGMF